MSPTDSAEAPHEQEVERNVDGDGHEPDAHGREAVADGVERAVDEQQGHVRPHGGAVGGHHAGGDGGVVRGEAAVLEQECGNRAREDHQSGAGRDADAEREPQPVGEVGAEPLEVAAGGMGGEQREQHRPQRRAEHAERELVHALSEVQRGGGAGLDEDGETAERSVRRGAGS